MILLNKQMLFEKFLSKESEEYNLKTIKKIGFEIDWFSRVNGRVLLSGRVSYESSKNFRSTENFREYLRENKINKNATFILLEDDHVSKFENNENFFVQRENQLKCDYLLFGNIKSQKRKFKVLRKKRFLIAVKNCLIYNEDNPYFSKDLTISCTFRNEML